MTSRLSTTALEALEHLLGEAIVTPLANGEVQVWWGPLPGRTVAALTRVDDVLWIFIDDAKPMMRGHAAELLADARASCDPDGVLRLRRIPTQIPDPRRPCHLEMVS